MENLGVSAASRETIVADCDAIIDDIGPAMDELAGTRILVTGASGFLLSYVVDAIARWNTRTDKAICHVVALDNYRTGARDRLSHLADRNDVTLLARDVNEPLDTSESVDWIIHGAGIASPTRYRRYPLETLDANIGGTRSVLEAARRFGVKRAVIMSSSEIYGDPDPSHIPTKETYAGSVSCIGPRACYDESKRVAETLSWIYRDRFDVPARVIRLFNVFGPGQRLDDGRIIPDLMNDVLNHRPITLYSDGSATRSFCYVSDAVRAILMILIEPNTEELVFNVGNEEGEISIRDLGELMRTVTRDITGSECPDIQFAKSEDTEYTTDNPVRRCPDLARIREEIGFSAKVSLRDALARTLRSYLEHQQ